MSAKNPHSQRLLAQVKQAQGIDKLLQVMAALRDPERGCPWDIKQDYHSILPFTIEEVYEVAETIENEDFENLPGELGDLLFQVVFYAQIAKEEGRFDFATVVEKICDKLVRRHPHVFSDQKFADDAELGEAWESAKAEERAGQAWSQQESKTQSVLDDIPKALPELKRAQKIQKRVARIGFDWTHVSQVWEKLHEECAEVKQAADMQDKHAIEDEIGDLLFAAVNLSRHYGVDADTALRKANQKFDKRFRRVEINAARPLKDYSLDQLEALWGRAKAEISETEERSSDKA